jgi:hypothetical protein
VTGEGFGGLLPAPDVFTFLGVLVPFDFFSFKGGRSSGCKKKKQKRIQRKKPNQTHTPKKPLAFKNTHTCDTDGASFDRNAYKSLAFRWSVFLLEYQSAAREHFRKKKKKASNTRRSDRKKYSSP